MGEGALRRADRGYLEIEQRRDLRRVAREHRSAEPGVVPDDPGGWRGGGMGDQEPERLLDDRKRPPLCRPVEPVRDELFEVEDGSGCFSQSGGEEREGAPVDAVKPLHFLDAVPPHPLPPRCIKVLREPASGMVARKVGRYSTTDAVHQEERRPQHQIGRASCRERVCQYVSISVVAVSLKKKTRQKPQS